MTLDPKEIQQADVWIDEKLYVTGVEAGDWFFDAYGEEQKGMAQVRNLQNIAFQSTRFSTIENFVKNQIGKEKEGSGWLKRDRGNLGLGDRVLQDFQTLSKKAEEWAKQDHTKKMEFQLRLVRAYVDALAAQFAYRKKGEQS